MDFILTSEFIYRTTLDRISAKIDDYRRTHKQENGRKIPLAYFLKNEEIKGEDKEPYYGNSLQSAKQMMSKIRKVEKQAKSEEEKQAFRETAREALTKGTLTLIAKAMGISVSELLWGTEKDWQKSLPALFLLLLVDVYDECHEGNQKFRDKTDYEEKLDKVLMDTVDFAVFLQQNELEKSLTSDTPVLIQEPAFQNAVLRLYQPDVADKFKQLFQQAFVTSQYALNGLNGYLFEFFKKVYHDILAEKEVEKGSLGKTAYDSLAIILSDNHINSLLTALSNPDEEYTSSEEDKIYQPILENTKILLESLTVAQKELDQLHGFQVNPKTLYTDYLEMLGMTAAYFESYYEPNIVPLSEKEINQLIDSEFFSE